MIPVFRPSCSNKEIEAVTKVLKSGWWGAGPESAKLEEEFAAHTRTRHAVSLSSCTAALHLAGKLLNLPEGSEVIVPAITFVSTAYIASYNGLKVVFADVEEDTLNIDPKDIVRKLTPKTKAIVAVHYGGQACDMDAIMKIAKEKGVYVIEDCAHAAGASYKGKMLGSIGDIGCFSFQAVKNLSSGDGGMLTTNNSEWDKRARTLRWVGINKDTSQRSKDQYSWEYAITEVGYKYQLIDILAAIARVQLKRLSELNSSRERIAAKYDEAFKDVEWIETPVIKENVNTSRHNYCIKTRYRDELMAYLKDKGISTSVHYKPLYMHEVYRNVKADCPIAEKVWKKVMLLPVYPDMTDSQVDFVIKSVKECQQI